MQSYSELYAQYSGGIPVVEAGAASELDAPEADLSDDPSLEVNEVLLGLMSEKDKLGELSRLLGKLRFAVEGRDDREVDEASAEISALGRHLPESFQVPTILAVAKDTSQRGSQLASFTWTGASGCPMGTSAAPKTSRRKSGP